MRDIARFSEVTRFRPITCTHFEMRYNDVGYVQMSADRCKQCRLKAESHYESAFQAFVSLSDSSSLESLRVQLERVALCEYQFASK